MIDEQMGVRQAAARAAMMVDPYWQRSPRMQAVLPELQVALQQGDSGVQVAAAGLLRRLTGRSASGAFIGLADAGGDTGERCHDRILSAVAGRCGRGRAVGGGGGIGPGAFVGHNSRAANRAVGQEQMGAPGRRAGDRRGFGFHVNGRPRRPTNLTGNRIHFTFSRDCF